MRNSIFYKDKSHSKTCQNNIVWRESHDFTKNKGTFQSNWIQIQDFKERHKLTGQDAVKSALYLVGMRSYIEYKLIFPYGFQSL